LSPEVTRDRANRLVATIQGTARPYKPTVPKRQTYSREYIPVPGWPDRRATVRPVEHVFCDCEACTATLALFPLKEHK